ncbi:toll/interleukin-1 receptor domain-containing protein [Polyangium aurulentum]|uniref:toll/interleukin-1 receptor domain-containing protein n=1 Tax=Polyangium aurulentum TaxID=2567896 RepID=UPI003B82F129
MLHLATRLRREGGLDVQIDQWHVAPGDPLPAFMERSIRTNDFVLVVCKVQGKVRRQARRRRVRGGYHHRRGLHESQLSQVHSHPTQGRLKIRSTELPLGKPLY